MTAGPSSSQPDVVAATDDEDRSGENIVLEEDVSHVPVIKKKLDPTTDDLMADESADILTG